MDLRDIQRLHEQYAQPVITIDVSAGSPAPRPAALAYATTEGESGRPGWPTTVGPRTKTAMLIMLVAVAALIVGMLLASATKRGQSEKAKGNVLADPPASTMPESPAHEWPPKSTGAPPDAPRPTSAPAEAPGTRVQTPVPAEPVATHHTTASVRPSAPRGVPAPAASVHNPPAAAKPASNNEVKLF